MSAPSQPEVPAKRGGWARAATWLLMVATGACLLGGMLAVSLPVYLRLSGETLVLITSGSMRPLLEPGECITIAPVAPADLEVGQVVTFFPPSDEALVTHRIIQFVELPQGLYLQMKGDANDIPDADLVPAGSVQGAMVRHVPEGARWVEFYGSTWGPLLLFGFPLVVIAGWQVVDLVRGIRELRGAPAPAPQDDGVPAVVAAGSGLADASQASGPQDELSPPTPQPTAVAHAGTVPSAAQAPPSSRVRRNFPALVAVVVVVGVACSLTAVGLISEGTLTKVQTSGDYPISIGGEAPPQELPSRDINTYVIFGFETVNLAGGSMGKPGQIMGGNIGANGSTDPNVPDLSMCVAGFIEASPDTQVVANRAGIGDPTSTDLECTLHHVFYNVPVGTPELPPGVVAVPFTPPLLPALPAFPDSACDPNLDVTLDGKPQNPVPLAPGTYGSVQITDGTVVTLATGTYMVCDWNMGSKAQVITEPGVVIQDAGTFTADDATEFGGPDCSTIPTVYVAGQGAGSNDSAVTFGTKSDIAGHFRAQVGELSLGDTNDIRGTFWAPAVSGGSVNVDYCAPPASP